LFKQKTDLEAEVKSMEKEMMMAKKDNWDYYTRLEKERN